MVAVVILPSFAEQTLKPMQSMGSLGAAASQVYSQAPNRFDLTDNTFGLAGSAGGSVDGESRFWETRSEDGV